MTDTNDDNNGKRGICTLDSTLRRLQYEGLDIAS